MTENEGASIQAEIQDNEQCFSTLLEIDSTMVQMGEDGKYTNLGELHKGSFTYVEYTLLYNGNFYNQNSYKKFIKQ